MTASDTPEFASSARRSRIIELVNAGRTNEAVSMLRQMCCDAPTDGWAWFFLGTLHGQRGEFDESVRCLRQAISINSQNADANYNLAQALTHLGRIGEAIAPYREVVELQPGNAPAWNNLGYVLNRSGQSEEAVACHRRALALHPDDAEALNNLGNALSGSGKPGEGLACYRAAVALRPDYAGAQRNLAGALARRGDLSAGRAVCDQALIVSPGDPKILVERGLLLQQQGSAADADDDFRRASERATVLDPAWTARLFNMNYYCDDPDEIFRAHRAWGADLAGSLPVPDAHANERNPGRRLRIGYVSTDLYRHSVAFFFESLLAAHDTTRFETFCYADVARPDAVTGRLRQHAAHWRDVTGLAPEAVASLVRDDVIDILVDLNGLTARHLPLLFARKPAPIQVNWLGYPNTTGMRTMDYRLTDAWADPGDDADRRHTEKLVRLPGGFLCYAPPEYAPPVVPPPSARRGYVTFGAFNTLAKVTPAVIEVWCRVLAMTLGSRLLFKSHAFHDQPTAAQFRRVFSDAGIAPERVSVRQWTPSPAEHLEMFSQVDICLDTFPYNGTTTTCEALWMGVPVVSLTGNRHAGRVGLSILSRVGLAELVATDLPEYVSIAAGLARDADRRTGLRADLRKRVAASPLCDAAGFAREVESAYLGMWQRWCANAAPGHAGE